MVSTIPGRLADRVRQTVVYCSGLDADSRTEHQIKVKELLFDNVYISKVIHHNQSWFTQLEVPDLTLHQVFCTINCFVRQPSTSMYFQPLAPPTLVWAAAAIHCVLSEYASGMKATVMFSQDEYQGIFGLFPLMNFTLEATTQSITHQQPLIPSHTPLLRHSTRKGNLRSSSKLLSLD
jgi:hypothetical protein